jgi:fucose 4-O-acetylase-like acetyltransferase
MKEISFNNFNYTINTYKALLILSVVIYHFMSAGNEITQWIKQAFSYFQMPVFFGISGYLIKRFLYTISFTELKKKYFYRIVIPYILAYTFYSLIQLSIINPLYTNNHLWFIPAFLIMIFCTYWVEKFNINRYFVFSIALSFTLGWLSFVVPGDGIQIAYYIGDKRYYYYFIFFYFGYLLRNYDAVFTTSIKVNFLIALISGIILFFFVQSATFLYSFSFIIFNLSVILLLIRYAQYKKDVNIPLISDLGSYTLPVYLWHMAPLYLMWKVRDLYHIHGLLYISAFFSLFILMVYLILKTKNTLFNKIFITGTYK